MTLAQGAFYCLGLAAWIFFAAAGKYNGKRLPVALVCGSVVAFGFWAALA